MSDQITRRDVEEWIELLGSGVSTDRLKGATELASLAIRTRPRGAVRTRGAITRAAPSRLPQEVTLSAVHSAFQDQHVEVRRAVAFAMGELAGENAVKALQQIAESDPDQAVRGEAIDALGKIGGEQAIEVLKRIARMDASGDIRTGALRALADLSKAEPSASRKVIEALEELKERASARELRAQIEEVLAKLG